MTTNVIEDQFKQARAHDAHGNLVVVRGDGKHLLLPAMRTTSMKPEMLAAIERIIPSTSKRWVAVIGETSWASSGQPSLQAANQAIPFWGLLMGFASVGKRTVFPPALPGRGAPTGPPTASFSNTQSAAPRPKRADLCLLCRGLCCGRLAPGTE